MTPARDGRAGSRRRGGGRRRRGLWALCAVLAVGLAGAVVAGRNAGRSATASHAAQISTRAPTTPPPAATPAPTRSPKPKPKPKPGATGADPGPESGTGRFSTAEAAGKPVGEGTVRRYKVQVEQGSGVSAGTAAREIEQILGDPRGWTADHHDAFQLVSGGSYDFEVKIATPATVDAICGAAGLHTHGEVNCDVGAQVIVNLKRWNIGSPEFPGPVTDYRALIINHEVGHRIGHGHETCPGPGEPAPAMMQQIDGLHGCVANAWPYDAHGRYLGGPHVP
ncbi:DUF3152 domain-containing protein [Streptomyces sp. NBC_01198]|nr:DUF3152 domain-containing protein [Streptomyces sp. NBC_01198]